MNKLWEFLATVWFYLKRLAAALGPFLLSLLAGAFFAGLDAFRAYMDNGHAFTWGSVWTIGAGAAGSYLILKALSADKKDWIRELLKIAEYVMSPREALATAAAQVQPLTPLAKIEEKVLPAVDQAPALVIVEKKEGI